MVEQTQVEFNQETDHIRDSGVISTVNIAKHPLHPALVTFPIALLTSTLGTDVLYFFTKELFWAKCTQVLLVAGLLSGVLAAMMGMIDFMRIKRVRSHRAGWLHMSLNITALSLALINLLIRGDDQVQNILPWVIVLSSIIASLLAASGWFGGELTFRHKIGVIGNSGQDV